MPRVTREERYVKVGYELNCGFERAQALARGLTEALKDEPALYDASDDTRGWDPENKSVVVVTYLTLKDANRLDQQVRQLLSRKADFTYDPNYGTGYGSVRPYLTVNPITTLSPH